MNKFLLIVELFSYIVNLLTRTSRQQELSSNEQKNAEKPIDRFSSKFGKPSVSDDSRTTEDTASLQQTDTSIDRPQ